LGIGPTPQSPIPNPQSPIPNPHFILFINLKLNLEFIEKNILLKFLNIRLNV
jgi:hypothetical protein